MLETVSLEINSRERAACRNATASATCATELHTVGVRLLDEANDKPIGQIHAFWSINIGLVAMVVMSMLPIGLIQHGPP
jgi:nitric oxide reductase large subunit